MALWQDVVYGTRTLLKRPGFTITAVLSLALGIGANTTIFSVINGTLLGNLPYKDPERLAVLWSIPADRPNAQGSASYLNFTNWKEQAKSFSNMGAIYGNDMNLGATEDGRPAERVEVEQFSASMWDVFGVKPMLGRVFTVEENVPANPAPVAVLSYNYWQRTYGGKPEAVGQTITLDSVKTTIIGVMPKGFYFGDEGTAMWIPTEYSLQQQTSTASFLLIVGRLKDGVSLQQAQAEMASIGKGLSAAYPDRNKNRTVRVQNLRAGLYQGLDEPLFVLQAAVVFVLLIACANIAGLLLARASARTTEVAIRGALGAGRSRMIRQMLTESVVLALAGGALGAVIGWAGLRILLASLEPGMLPAELGVDYRVLGFTALVSILTGLLFGLVPALQVSKVDLVTALKETGRTGMDAGHKQRIRSIMVAAQIGLALVLLIGAGLMMKSFQKLQSNSLGLDPSNVLAFDFRYGQNQLMHPVGRHAGVGLWEIFPVAGQTYQRIFERIRSIPGVVGAAAISRRPGAGNWMSLPFRIPGRAAPDPNAPGGNGMNAAYFAVTSDYFHTMRIPVLGGREFNDRDTSTAPPVILINKAMADRWFPNQNPIGQRIALDFVPDEPLREIVGLVGNTRPGVLFRICSRLRAGAARAGTNGRRWHS
jgi:putative ABC transport system permease protein